MTRPRPNRPDQSDTNHLPPLREVIAAHGLSAKKSLGQNYLLDSNITEKIVRQAGPLDGHSVIEIGPGPGGLTRALIDSSAAQVIAVERDERFRDALAPLVDHAGDRLSLVAADALTIDPVALAPAPRAIIANLPYNIATPLLVQWLRQAKAFAFLLLMFQKEVADRLVASPGTKAYGRLSVITQWRCQATAVMTLPPRVFTPPPKVTSTVVFLRPRPDLSESPAVGSMETVTAAAFGQRRKMLRQSLKSLSADPQTHLLDPAGISPEARAETIDVSGYVTLARLYERLKAAASVD